MKPFDDLTDIEVLHLTDEQVDWYIDRECAEAGIPLVHPTAPEAPVTLKLDPSLKHFVVGGVLRFTDRREADRIADAIRACITRRITKTVGYRWDGKTFDAPDETDVLVSEERVYTETDAVAQNAATDMVKEKTKEYEQARKEYDAAVSGRTNTATAIRSRVERAWSKQRRADRLTAEFDRYLTLADGSRAIAARFLAKAHSDAQDVVPNLFVGVALDPISAPASEVDATQVPF